MKEVGIVVLLFCVGYLWGEDIINTKKHLQGALVFAISQGTATLEDVKELESMGVDLVVRGISCGWYASPKDMLERSMAVGEALRESYKRKILWSAMITSSAIIPDILPEKDVALYADRDAQGNVIKIAPWWQGCLNNPHFSNFVKEIAKSSIDAGIVGIHYDESYGHWFWTYPVPCFCDYCIEGFREWLKKEKPPILKDLGISDLEKFNYRDFLAQGQLQDKPWESPLHPEYWRFLLYSTLEMEKEIVEESKGYCRGKWGKELIANANQYDMVNLCAVVVGESKIYDFVNIGWGLDRLPPRSSYIPSYLASKAIGYDRPVVMFLDIQEEPAVFASLSERGKGQLFQWLSAEAYSSGCFYALHHRFSLWKGPVNELVRIGRFVKAHPHLFRDTKPSPDVFLLYSFASNIYDMFSKYWGRKDMPDHSKAYDVVGQMLTNCGVQFAGLFLGEGRAFPNSVATCEKGAFSKLSPQDFPHIIVPSAYALTAENIRMLRNYAEAGGKLLLLGRCGEYDEKLQKRVADPWGDLIRKGRVTYLPDFFENPPHVQLEKLVGLLEKGGWTPRVVELSAKPSTHKIIRRSKDSLILHFINKNFREGEGFKPVNDLKVVLKLPPGFKPTSKILYYSPDWDSPKEGKVALKEDSVFLSLPSFDVWLIGELKGGR